MPSPGEATGERRLCRAESRRPGPAWSRRAGQLGPTRHAESAFSRHRRGHATSRALIDRAGALPRRPAPGPAEAAAATAEGCSASRKKLLPVLLAARTRSSLHPSHRFRRRRAGIAARVERRHQLRGTCRRGRSRYPGTPALGTLVIPARGVVRQQPLTRSSDVTRSPCGSRSGRPAGLEPAAAPRCRSSAGLAESCRSARAGGDVATVEASESPGLPGPLLRNVHRANEAAGRTGQSETAGPDGPLAHGPRLPAERRGPRRSPRTRGRPACSPSGRKRQRRHSSARVPLQLTRTPAASARPVGRDR